MVELADAGAVGFDAERLSRIAPFLAEAYVDNGRLPNAQLLIARDGQPVHYTKLGKMGDDWAGAKAACESFLADAKAKGK